MVIGISGLLHILNTLQFVIRPFNVKNMYNRRTHLMPTTYNIKYWAYANLHTPSYHTYVYKPKTLVCTYHKFINSGKEQQKIC